MLAFSLLGELGSAALGNGPMQIVLGMRILLLLLRLSGLSACEYIFVKI